MIEFADELRGRDGRLSAAVSRIYARQLATRPELAETMRRLNRAKEVDLGLQRRTFAAPLGMTGISALPSSTASSAAGFHQATE
jgi:hypothetical protein